MAEANHMLYRCFDLALRRQTAAHEHAACTRRWAAQAGPRASPVFQSLCSDRQRLRHGQDGDGDDCTDGMLHRCFNLALRRQTAAHEQAGTKWSESRHVHARCVPARAGPASSRRLRPSRRWLVPRPVSVASFSHARPSRRWLVLLRASG